MYLLDLFVIVLSTQYRRIDIKLFMLLSVLECFLLSVVFLNVNTCQYLRSISL